MNFLVQRYSDDGQSTQGLLFRKALEAPIFFAHSLEDEFRKEKVAGETRIPASTYELKIHKVETPLTLKHRIAYNKPGNEWFKYHIEITGIPNFKLVFIHGGNKDTHTAGCLLLADTTVNNQIEDGLISRSIQAVERFYKLVYPVLEKGEQKCFIEFRDEKTLR